MDYLDWTTYIAGGALGLLTLGAGFSRLSGAVERDIAPIWQLGFIVAGGVFAASLIGGWIFPIVTTVYVANGSSLPRQVKLGDDVLCLPAKSYQGFVWRLFAPESVTVEGPGPEAHYHIGKGTWFINTARTTISADMYTNTESVVFGALDSSTSGAIHVDSRYGRPLRMFSQSSFDRVYSADGDIFERSTSGPCPKSASAATSATNANAAGTGLSNAERQAEDR